MSKLEYRKHVLEHKIEELEKYHDSPICPFYKLTIIEKLLKKYSFRLQRLNCL